LEKGVGWVEGEKNCSIGSPQVKNDDRNFEVSLDTHHFRPDELKGSVL
jgi:hypothetical protein